MEAVREPRTGWADVAGTSLYYEVVGEGPDLVLAHAGFVDRRMWDPQIPVLAQHYRVTRYDRRGFGASKPGLVPFSHRGDLYELLGFLGISRAHLLGCSAGGSVVTDFALEHPEVAESLVLVSSALGGYQFQGEMPRPLQELLAALQANDLPRAADIAVQLWIDGPERMPQQVEPHVRDLAREMAITALPNIFVAEEPLDPPAIGRLHEIGVPALVVVGDLDDPSIAAIADVLATGIPGARRATITGAAHLPSLEKPEEFNRILLEFLNAPGE